MMHGRSGDRTIAPKGARSICRPSGAGDLGFCFPKAYAVGFILPPLRGEDHGWPRMLARVSIHRCLLIVFASAFISSPILGEDARETFFDHQRRGANYFNQTPREQWFADAVGADIDWARMTWSKWAGAEGEFLVGNRDEAFERLVPGDLAKLKEVLDWAERRHVKVVLTPLSLPGGAVAAEQRGEVRQADVDG